MQKEKLKTKDTMERESILTKDTDTKTANRLKADRKIKSNGD